MGALQLVKLDALMARTTGREEVAVGLVDGPVAADHPELAGKSVRYTAATPADGIQRCSGVACAHGTFVAGILLGERNSVAPAICPGCTLLVRPIFPETTSPAGETPTATPEELAAAIVECVDEGVHVVNLSAAISQPSSRGERELQQALDYAARRGVITVAAAGNQGTVGSSAITRHPWVVPVVACDVQGVPLGYSNLGNSIGRRGLRAPGDAITSLGTNGTPFTLGGTSAAAPFVTGTVALLWSEFPAATATEIRLAVSRARRSRRITIVPDLLDAWEAYQTMRVAKRR